MQPFHENIGALCANPGFSALMGTNKRHARTKGVPCAASYAQQPCYQKVVRTGFVSTAMKKSCVFPRWRAEPKGLCGGRHGHTCLATRTRDATEREQGTGAHGRPSTCSQ